MSYIKNIYRKIGCAIGDYKMINHGDKILVALSGGKDSFTMLDALSRLQKRAPVEFSLFVSIVHPGFPGFSTDTIVKWLEENRYDFQVIKSDIYETVFNDREKAEDGCFYCSRQRRSVLYRQADLYGCHKIALGHHSDDFIESVLLSMMYNGKIETMLPVFEADSKKFKVIRPLMYLEEEKIRRYALEKGFPVTCCCCPLCHKGNLRRKKVKKMLSEFAKDEPNMKGSLFRSLSNFNAEHMLDLAFNKTLKDLIILQGKNNKANTHK